MDRDSSPTSQMRRYSPEVAIKSLWVPACNKWLLAAFAYGIRDPHNLGWRVLMFKVRAVFEVALFLIQLDDLYLVSSVLNEGAQCQPEVLLRPV